MIKIITIPIEHLDALYVLRAKLYELGNFVSQKPDFAVQMAGDFSTLGKYLLLKANTFHFELVLESSDSLNYFRVTLILEKNIDHLDEIKVKRSGFSGYFENENWIFVKRYGFSVEDKKTIDPEALSRILTNKTKEELFNDLNRKNIQLQVEIEERISAEEALRESQRDLVAAEKLAALGGLVAGIAHEVNTPVGIGVTASSHLRETIDAFAALCAEGKLKRSDLDTLVSSIRDLNGMVEDNLQRASSLIRSFKEVAVDQTAEDEREFYLKQYVNQVVNSLSPKLRNRAIEIILDGIDESITLNTTPGPISQIFTNLIVNSLVHGFDLDQSGRIMIAAKRDDDTLLLTYSDSGKGIAAENLEKIFDPFFTTKRSHGGSGLGMHLIYNIVTKKYLGQIKCESELNQGVVFHMSLHNVF